MNGIFWLKDVEAYAVNPGGTYATNVDLSCLLNAGFELELVADGARVSHPLCNGSVIVKSGRHLLYTACLWGEHHARRGKLNALNQLVWWAMDEAIPACERAEDEI